MSYALIITLIAGVTLLTLIAVAFALGRRLAGGEWPAIGGWSWRPTPAGLLLLVPLAGLLLWRLLPALLVLPLMFLLRGLRLRSMFGGGDDGDDGAIDGEFRRVE